MAEENKSYYMIIAIVAIVAIVALVMIIGKAGQRQADPIVYRSGNSVNLGGQAVAYDEERFSGKEGDDKDYNYNLGAEYAPDDGVTKYGDEVGGDTDNLPPNPGMDVCVEEPVSVNVPNVNVEVLPYIVSTNNVRVKVSWDYQGDARTRFEVTKSLPGPYGANKKWDVSSVAPQYIIDYNPMGPGKTWEYRVNAILDACTKDEKTEYVHSAGTPPLYGTTPGPLYSYNTGGTWRFERTLNLPSNFWLDEDVTFIKLTTTYPPCAKSGAGTCSTATYSKEYYKSDILSGNKIVDVYTGIQDPCYQCYVACGVASPPASCTTIPGPVTYNMFVKNTWSNMMDVKTITVSPVMNGFVTMK